MKTKDITMFNREFDQGELWNIEDAMAEIEEVYITIHYDLYDNLIFHFEAEDDMDFYVWYRACYDFIDLVNNGAFAPQKKNKEIS